MAKWLYRLESTVPEKGLWYNSKKEFVCNVKDVPGNTTHTLPMDYDSRYQEGDKDWFSACSQLEDLTYWFSIEDAKQLVERDFVFTKYLAQDYREYDKETVFLKEAALDRVVLNVDEIFNRNGEK